MCLTLNVNSLCLLSLITLSELRSNSLLKLTQKLQSIPHLLLSNNNYMQPLRKQRRYYECDARRHAVCVSTALVSTAKVMRCIKHSLVVTVINYNNQYNSGNCKS